MQSSEAAFQVTQAAHTEILESDTLLTLPGAPLQCQGTSESHLALTQFSRCQSLLNVWLSVPRGERVLLGSILILRAPQQPSADAFLCAPGLSFCQLHRQQVLLSSYINSTDALYLPQCQDSGNYAPVQCDLQQVQCWCVDTEGMEVYGTRQWGRPTRCKCRRYGHQNPWVGLQFDAPQITWLTKQSAWLLMERKTVTEAVA